MYVEQQIVDINGQLRIALAWQSDIQRKLPEEEIIENAIIIDLDVDNLENIVNFDLN